MALCVGEIAKASLSFVYGSQATVSLLRMRSNDAFLWFNFMRCQSWIGLECCDCTDHMSSWPSLKLPSQREQRWNSQTNSRQHPSHWPARIYPMLFLENPPLSRAVFAEEPYLAHSIGSAVCWNHDSALILIVGEGEAVRFMINSQIRSRSKTVVIIPFTNSYVSSVCPREFRNGGN